MSVADPDFFSTDCIAEKIKKAIEIRNSPALRKISTVTGINFTQLSRWINGDRIPNLQHLIELSKYFRVGIEFFIIPHSTFKEYDLKNFNPRNMLNPDDISPELIDKLQIIASYEKREYQNQVLFFLENAIAEYCSKNPDIFNPSSLAGQLSLTELEKLFTFAKITGSKKLNILIVDDFPTSAEMLEFLLNSYGHNASTAATINEAILIYKKIKFDAAIIDFHFPDDKRTGKDLVKELTKINPSFNYALITGDQRQFVKDQFVGFHNPPKLYINKDMNSTEDIQKWLFKIGEQKRS